MTEHKLPISVGDEIQWIPSFGMSSPEEAVVEGISITANRHQKYGDDAEIATAQQLNDDLVVVFLTCGKWCYANQLLPKQTNQQPEEISCH